MPMHKRMICALLALIIMLGLIPAFALTSRAASNMKTGEQCIQILKDMEGFLKYPVWDHTHYSVGYGSSCEKGDYPNGITEEEADALLREFLATMESELNRFADRNNILFSQNRFDALMLFTYNCGTGWLYSDGDFRQAVLDDATGNEFIFYLSQWCIASGEVLPSLVNRRLIEADMYLNGSYANRKPTSYTHVLFNNNGGEGSVRVQGYDSNLTAYVKSTPTRKGYKFLGWYSEAAGGSWITELTEQHAGKTLYAHWQGADPVAASYQHSSGLLVTLEIYDAPNGSVTGTLMENVQISICGEYLDTNGTKWGKLPNGGWVNLGDPRIGNGDETAQKTGIEVTVTGDCVNVRTGPGTRYQAVSAVWRGDVLLITETETVNDDLWGRFRTGWINLRFTDYALTQSGGASSGENKDQVIAIGTVRSEGLNIRDAAGSHGNPVGAYRKNERVEILEKTDVGGTPWGRTDRGWICLDYVDLEELPEEPETTEPETTVPETTEPETTVPGTEEEVPAVQGIPATVISRTMLNIRSGPGTDYPRVGSYSPGQQISVLEQKTVGSVIWGRTDKGWVSLQYVRLDEIWKNESGIYGVVNCTGALNIRSGPGVGYRPVGAYAAGSRIVILEQTVVSGKKWGRTEKGWVSMDFVRLEASVETPGESQNPENTEPEATEPETTVPETTVPETPEPPETVGQVTGTVTADYLNIRNAAGTGGKIVGSYKRGTKVTILEQKNVNGTAWGRTDKGWISLAYVKLDVPENQTPARSGVITADVLNIRKGPGTGNAVVGSYTHGQTVTILETSQVGATTWGRTDKGWICMDYVK